MHKNLEGLVAVRFVSRSPLIIIISCSALIVRRSAFGRIYSELARRPSLITIITCSYLNSQRSASEKLVAVRFVRRLPLTTIIV